VAEGLSETLRALLSELGLCSPADLRSAGRAVRRLSRDLPPFDSVWLDALVQAGSLSPFQARVLESDHPETIRVGPCVLFDRIGGGPLGQTFAARPIGGGPACAIKVLTAADRLTAETDEQLLRLIDELKPLRHPSLVVPQACDRANGRLVLVSRYVAGPTLAEMLIRRGRFPAAVVVEIGRQLIDGLSALALRGHAHGDIRAANVRLTSAGVAVLVDAAVRPVLDAALSVHSGLPPDRYDGVAPELIGTGRVPDAASDMYALGCLLWHLLAGRPPFPGGDPLAKLAAHQTRAIDDVRKWAPDTPPAIAQALALWTRRDLAERPAGWEQLARQWGAPRASGRRVLKGFLSRFRTPATPPPAVLSRSTRRVVAAVLLFAFSGAGLLVDQFGQFGARDRILSWTARYLPASTDDDIPAGDAAAKPRDAVTADASSTADARLSGIPLPPPDARGVIRLDKTGPYRPADITAVGGLSIVGSGDKPATIIVSDRPLKLWAESVSLQNVRLLRREPPQAAGAALPALVLVQSQHLDVERCRFETALRSTGDITLTSASAGDLSEGPIALAWKLLDPRDLRGGTGAVRDSLFLGDAPVLHLAGAVGRLQFDNSLKLGAGPLVQLAAGPSANRDIRLELASTTCRASGPILRWNVPPEWSGKGRIVIDAQDAVFDTADGAPLLEFVTPAYRQQMGTAVQLTGTGSLAPPEVSIAAHLLPSDGSRHNLDPAPFQIEGLVSGPFEYQAPPSPHRADSLLKSCDAPRSSARLPGISTP
jgi:eukaryotic-like serine/threonine-protein kinase